MGDAGARVAVRRPSGGSSSRYCNNVIRRNCKNGFQTCKPKIFHISRQTHFHDGGWLPKQTSRSNSTRKAKELPLAFFFQKTTGRRRSVSIFCRVMRRDYGVPNTATSKHKFSLLTLYPFAIAGSCTRRLTWSRNLDLTGPIKPFLSS
jgi:hypothetical protein